MKTVNKKVIVEYVSTEGYKVVICKPQKTPKTVTAKMPGSLRHCGRTNSFGIRI
jgi:hypothetical protein